MPCACKCKFDGTKYNSNQKWNNNKCWCECENSRKLHVSEKYYIRNPSICTSENDNTTTKFEQKLLQQIFIEKR